MIFFLFYAQTFSKNRNQPTNARVDLHVEINTIHYDIEIRVAECPALLEHDL
jgi:hypothetical protein